MRSLSTAAMFYAIKILLFPPYTTVVPFLYIFHFTDLEPSRPSLMTPEDLSVHLVQAATVAGLLLVTAAGAPALVRSEAAVGLRDPDRPTLLVLLHAGGGAQ